MAGITTQLNGMVVHLDFTDGKGEAVVNGRKWRWEFHRYLGPTFLRKDGEPRKRWPGEKHPVWDAFQKWLKEWEKRCPDNASRIKELFQTP